MTEHTMRDDIDGAIQKLCSISCQNEGALKTARDTLKRISTRVKDGISDYEPLVERVVQRLMSERKGDDWFMKHRLLEVIPTFVHPGEKYVIIPCATFLKHENWMIRQAAIEALGFLMNRKNVALPHCASKPGTRTNSRPPSPGKSALRPANPPVKARLEKGIVIDHEYGAEAIRNMQQQNTKATRSDDGESRYTADEDHDEGSSCISKGSKGSRATLSERSGSVASSRVSHKAREGAGGKGIIERSQSLEAVQEESRIGTAVSEGTRTAMMTTGAFDLSDVEKSLAEDDGLAEAEDAIDWDDIMEELLPLIQEALDSPESDVRRAALMALRKTMCIGDYKAMPCIRTAFRDDDWACREAAALVLREFAVPGEEEALSMVMEMLEDARREVRESALNALETAGRPGDFELLVKLVAMKEYSKKWSEKTNRPPWEIRETACRAIGVIADLDCQDAIESLKKSLGDERVDVQRSATHALGKIAERVVPEDMIWTYNNVTAQPAPKSTWLNMRWNVMRQAYIPTASKVPIDKYLKHSPRECIQALTKTPRGGSIPHLLLTPRQEHLYEGDDIQRALDLREEQRKDGERKQIIFDLARRIKDAIERHDSEEVERLQAELAAFEAQEDDEEGSDDDDDGGRSHVTKSMASLDDLGSEDLDDAQSQVSFSSSRVGGAKSAVSFRLNPTYN